MPLAPHKTSITVNGTKVKIAEGTNSFQQIVDAALNDNVTLTNPTTITVVSTVSKASSIKGNDSYVIDGGEVFTIA